MKKREDISIPVTGGSALLVIFAVLCLVIFSLLSLNTVLSEKRISEASARVTEDWYAADLRAQEVFARLRAGERVDGVMQTGQTYTYAFFDPDVFISVLIAGGLEFRIIKPNWLREHMKERLSRLLKIL